MTKPVTGRIQGLVDQDVKPRDRLLSGIGDRFDLEVGVAPTEPSVTFSPP